MNLKLTLVGFLISFASVLFGQSLYLEAGANYGRFYDFLGKPDEQFIKDYERGVGFRFDLRLTDIKIDTLLNFQFALGFEQYHSAFYVYNGGLGGGIREGGSLTKQVIDVEFYPVNLRFIKKMTFSLGLGVNFMVDKKLQGSRFIWSISEPMNPEVDFNTIHDFVNPINWGLKIGLGHEFTIGNLLLKPSYKYFLGLSQEFDFIQSYARSQRHSLILGIGYVLK